MLKLEVPKQELWDEEKNEFVDFKGYTLSLEHSLVSISKWESKFHKPFISNRRNDNKSQEELKYYVKCMTITQNVPDYVYGFLTDKNYDDIRAYMEDTRTATTFNDASKKGSSNNKTITSEIIYYWMIAENIPVEFQKWHINRLLTLIKVCNNFNSRGSNKKKMSKSELLARNRRLNEARRKN